MFDAMTDTKRRVKLYALNADRQWDDRGTGHVSCTYVERLKGVSLLVRAEADGEYRVGLLPGSRDRTARFGTVSRCCLRSAISNRHCVCKCTLSHSKR